MAATLALHVFNCGGSGESVIRVHFTAAEMNSSRVRTSEESRALNEFGRGVQCYQLQGDLSFTATEALVRQVQQDSDGLRCLLLDLKRVLGINESACRLFYQLLVKLSDAGKSMGFAHTEHIPLLRRYMTAKLEKRF